MRINLPSAILLSGTVLLLSPLCAMANANEAATLEAGKSTEIQATTAEASSKTAETKVVETKTTDATAAKGAETKAADAAGAPPVPGQPQLGPHGGMFRFGEQAEKNPIVDAPEAIEKAKALHLQAMDQAKSAKDPKEVVGIMTAAMVTEQKAIDAAPHYWLPHAGMVYLMMNARKKPIDVMKEASQSIYGTHNAVAERNSAKLFQMLRWNQPAVKALQTAVQMEPNSWEPRVSLADMQLAAGNANEAKADLDKINLDALTTYEAVSSVGAHYLSLDDFAKAKQLIEKAQTLAPDEAAKTECTDRLFIIGAKTHDEALIKATIGKLSDHFKAIRPDLVMQARVSLATSPADADAIFKEAANLQSKSPGDVFFNVGREMFDRAQTLKASNPAEAKAWMVRANQAFKNAITRDQSALIYRVFDIASLNEAGDKPGVLTAYESFRDSIPAGSDVLKLSDVDPKEAGRRMQDYSKYVMVKSFEPVKDEPGSFKSHARELKFKILKSSCSCHARGMRKGLSQEPGVMFTAVSRDDKPVITVIYDERTSNAKKLMAAKIVQTYKDPIELVTDLPMDSFNKLSVAILEQQDQRPAIQLKREVSFEVPMETSGQVAQNTENPVR